MPEEQQNTMEAETCIIELCCNRYECKVVNGERKIKHGTEFVGTSEFIDRLCDNQQWDEVTQLALLGRNVITETLSPVE